MRTCDQWWEPETEWHPSWKNEFPTKWQEIVHIAPNGEKHIADVKTVSGLVIEFQHSFLKPEERRAREAFYRKMVWVVDERRRKRDAAQLTKCIGPCIFARPPYILHNAYSEESALLRDWNDSLMPVYFDLGTRAEDGHPVFWRRDPISRRRKVYLTPVHRASFLKVHLEGMDAETAFSERVAVIVEERERASRMAFPMPLPRHYQARRRGYPRF